ncbi:MAG: 4-aminobutyrate--2-oxoglutarate transaminase [Planctomycetota bacterium]|nr:4-aminobutyrate--2-oxoglutarate transaminase [Planctomycetota bacterium]
MTRTKTATVTNAALHARRQAIVARGVASLFPIFPARAKNAELWDVEGRRYLDFSGGIGVLNVGHAHPAVEAAITQQLSKYVHPAFQVMAYEPYIELAERLAALAPGDGPNKVAFFSTGAEAVENAVKIARAHTGRHAIITFAGGFHGRTLLTLAMTGKVVPYKTAFGPMPAGVFHVPYPMAYRGITIQQSLDALEMVFRADVGPTDVAAIVLEPVVGEGGFYAAPPEFLKALRALCDRHGILLVADEVQSGFGRTGRMFAMEHAGVVPDLMTMAKSLADGLPLSGVVGKAAVMDAPDPGGLGGTYGGNPVACAAALAVLDVIEAEGLLERAESQGQAFERHFQAVQAEPGMACLGEVRRLGAMAALEFVKDRATREPDKELTHKIRSICLERGLIALSCGVFGNVIRILAPLTTPEGQYHEGLDILATSIRTAVTS